MFAESDSDSIRFDGDGAVLAETRRSRGLRQNRLDSRLVSVTRFDPKGRVLARYPAQGEAPEGRQVWTNAHHLFSYEANGRLEVRRSSDFRLIRVLRVGEQDFPSFDSNARRGVAIDDRGVLRFWAGASSPIATFPVALGGGTPNDPRFGSEYFAEMSPDGTKALAGRQGRGFKVWDARTFRLLADVAFEDGEEQASWDEGSGIVQIDNGTSRVARYDVGTKRRTTDEEPSLILGRIEALSPDGRLAAVEEGGAVEIRSRRSGRRLSRLGTQARSSPPNAEPERIAGLRFSPDGRSLHVLYESGKLRTFRADF